MMLVRREMGSFEIVNLTFSVPLSKSERSVFYLSMVVSFLPESKAVCCRVSNT